MLLYAWQSGLVHDLASHVLFSAEVASPIDGRCGSEQAAVDKAETLQSFSILGTMLEFAETRRALSVHPAPRSPSHHPRRGCALPSPGTVTTAPLRATNNLVRAATSGALRRNTSEDACAAEVDGESGVQQDDHVAGWWCLEAGDGNSNMGGVGDMTTAVLRSFCRNLGNMVRAGDRCGGRRHAAVVARTLTAACRQLQPRDVRHRRRRHQPQGVPDKSVDWPFLLRDEFLSEHCFAPLRSLLDCRVEEQLNTAGRTLSGVRIAAAMGVAEVLASMLESCEAGSGGNLDVLLRSASLRHALSFLAGGLQRATAMVPPVSSLSFAAPLAAMLLAVVPLLRCPLAWATCPSVSGDVCAAVCAAAVSSPSSSDVKLDDAVGQALLAIASTPSGLARLDGEKVAAMGVVTHGMMGGMTRPAAASVAAANMLLLPNTSRGVHRSAWARRVWSDVNKCAWGDGDGLGQGRLGDPLLPFHAGSVDETPRWVQSMLRDARTLLRAPEAGLLFAAGIDARDRDDDSLVTCARDVVHTLVTFGGQAATDVLTVPFPYEDGSTLGLRLLRSAVASLDTAVFLDAVVSRGIVVEREGGGGGGSCNGSTTAGLTNCLIGLLETSLLHDESGDGSGNDGSRVDTFPPGVEFVPAAGTVTREAAAAAPVSRSYPGAVIVGDLSVRRQDLLRCLRGAGATLEGDNNINRNDGGSSGGWCRPLDVSSVTVPFASASLASAGRTLNDSTALDLASCTPLELLQQLPAAARSEASPLRCRQMAEALCRALPLGTTTAGDGGNDGASHWQQQQQQEEEEENDAERFLCRGVEVVLTLGREQMGLPIPSVPGEAHHLDLTRLLRRLRRQSGGGRLAGPFRFDWFASVMWLCAKASSSSSLFANARPHVQDSMTLWLLSDPAVARDLWSPPRPLVVAQLVAEILTKDCPQTACTLRGEGISVAALMGRWLPQLFLNYLPLADGLAYAALALTEGCAWQIYFASAVLEWGCAAWAAHAVAAGGDNPAAPMCCTLRDWLSDGPLRLPGATGAFVVAAHLPRMLEMARDHGARCEAALR